MCLIHLTGMYLIIKIKYIYIGISGSAIKIRNNFSTTIVSINNHIQSKWFFNIAYLLLIWFCIVCNKPRIAIERKSYTFKNQNLFWLHLILYNRCKNKHNYSPLFFHTNICLTTKAKFVNNNKHNYSLLFLRINICLTTKAKFV